MNNNTYIPKAIDTSAVKLTPDLLALIELLAANTHEVWSAGRIAEGWTYGPVRDDVKKEHPDLVPYDQLTYEEQQYDRSTAMETIKLLLSLGYTIKK